NDWTPVSITADDVMEDTPTNNFAVLNPLCSAPNKSQATPSKGNLVLAATGSNGSNFYASTIGMTRGMYYMEGAITTLTPTAQGFGITASGDGASAQLGNDAYSYAIRVATTGGIVKRHNATDSSSLGSYTAGDIL